MPQSEARAWWADVQHVRESIERRREDAARSPLGKDAGRFARTGEPAPAGGDDRDRAAETATAREGRFDRDTRQRHADRSLDPDGSSSTTARRSAAAHRDRERAARARRPRPEAEHDRVRAHRPSGDRGDQAGEHRGTAETMTAPPPGRRTVQITGRPAASAALPRLVEVERRRPARRPVERVGARPDRIAMWAVLLGFFLVLVAATSSHAATPAAAPAATAAAHTLAVPHRGRASTARVAARRATAAAPARIAAR